MLLSEVNLGELGSDSELESRFRNQYSVVSRGGSRKNERGG